MTLDLELPSNYKALRKKTNGNTFSYFSGYLQDKILYFNLFIFICVSIYKFKHYPQSTYHLLNARNKILNFTYASV